VAVGRLGNHGDRTYLSLSVIDVEGGDIVLKPSDLSGFSVLEQLAAVETRLDSVNTEVTIRGGFAESTVRRLPPAAVREAVLNGLVHRDWMLADPVKITCTGRLSHASDQSRRFHRRHYRRDCAYPTVRPPPGLG
jgi:hypothetical protein